MNVEPFEHYMGRYEEWFERNPFAYQAELQAVRRLLPPGGTGMEIGSGTGRFAVPLGIKIGVEPANASCFINGFVDRNSFLGKIYQRYKNQNEFYSIARFYSVDEVISLLEKAKFQHFSFTQTVWGMGNSHKS